jgi:uncharacterized protein (TIGR02646 family)
VKYIQKRAQPRSLYRWHLDNGHIPDAKYNSHGFPTKDVHLGLLKEQGGICAYTMIRIDVDSSHIEHLKPRTVSISEQKFKETAQYRNMVACYPREKKKGEAPLAFGAIFRGSAWDSQLFLTPLTQSCESRIRFTMDGKVRPRSVADKAAKWTIAKLGLDNSKLEVLRRAAIEATGLSLTSDSPTSREEAVRITTSICNRNSDDIFEPHCIALKHAAEEYIKVLDKMERRKQFAAARRRRKRR